VHSSKSDEVAIDSDMAMTQLLVSQRPSLQNIIVKGDLIIDESNRDSESDTGIERLFTDRRI
jgi:hypothetical protein